MKPQIAFPQECTIGSRSPRFARVAILASALAIAASAAARDSDDEVELEVDGNVRFGAQYLDVDGDKAKFNEYRSIEEDFGLVLEDVLLRGVRGSYHFLATGEDLNRVDQRSARIEGGRYGKFLLGLAWDETPHHFAEDVAFIGTLQGESYWAVPDVVQQTLEPDFPLGGNPPNTPTPAGVANLLDLLENAGRLDLGLVRETGTLDLDYTALEDLDLRLNYLHRRQQGLRPISTGAYRRDSDGAALVGGLGENFMIYGLEFPEPIDYRTNEAAVGANYKHKKFRTDVSYQFLAFDNKISDVTWDNPLRLNGVDAITYGAALNRLDLFPSYNKHLVSFTGQILDLPLHSRFTTTASWGRVLQSDDFLAYTVNDVLTVSGGPNIGALARDLPLPANDLDGKVDSIFVNALLSSRPIDRLSMDFKINYYNYDDKSDRINWPDGWARVGESEWAATTEFLPPNLLFNRVPDWWRLRPSADVSYRVTKALLLLADYTYEVYGRDDRNAETDEHRIGGRIKLDPTNWSSLRVGYHWADRSIDGTYTPAPAPQFFEWDQLRAFDQSDRTRNSVEGYLNVNPREDLSLGFSIDWRRDEYDKDFYGLQERAGYTTGIDVNYAISDRVSVFAYYSRDDFDTDSKLRSKSDALGAGSFAVAENDFLTMIADTTDTIGGEVEFVLIPDRLVFEVTADYSYGKSKFDNSNPNFAAGVTTSSAMAYDWPDTRIKTTRLRADLEYQWTERLSSGFRYLYERFDLSDAFTDTVVPYGNATDIQGNALDYFIFLDSNYSDYTAHLFTWTVSYAF